MSGMLWILVPLGTTLWIRKVEYSRNVTHERLACSICIRVALDFVHGWAAFMNPFPGALRRPEGGIPILWFPALVLVERLHPVAVSPFDLAAASDGRKPECTRADNGGQRDDGGKAWHVEFSSPRLLFCDPAQRPLIITIARNRSIMKMTYERC